MKFLLKINCTSNNTILTLTDKKLKTLTTVSTGKVGFKGAKRSTYLAAEKAANEISQYIGKFKNLTVLSFFIKEPVEEDGQ